MRAVSAIGMKPGVHRMQAVEGCDIAAILGNDGPGLFGLEQNSLNTFDEVHEDS